MSFQELYAHMPHVKERTNSKKILYARQLRAIDILQVKKSTIFLNLSSNVKNYHLLVVEQRTSRQEFPAKNCNVRRISII
jgi:hypothetical protein